MRQKIVRALEDGMPWELQYTVTGQDGEKRILHCMAAPGRSGSGPVRSMTGMVKDVSEEKRQQTRLRESERYFRLVFENAKDNIFIKDLNHRYTHVNPEMLQLHGMSAEEVIGKTACVLFGQDGGEHIRQVDDKVLAGHVLMDEFTHESKGRLITFDVIKVPIFNHEGEIFGLCGIARVITERKAREARLKASQAMNQALLDSTTNGACLVDAKGRIEACNEVWRRMYGRPGLSYQGKSFLDFLPQNLARSRRKYFRQAVLEGITTRFQDQKGDRYYENIFHPILEEDDEVGKIALYSSDITDSKLAEIKTQMHQRRLRSLATELSLVENRERRRLAEILHDQIGQNLAFSLSGLKAQTKLVQDEKLKADMEQLVSILKQTVRDTKSLTLQLSPPLLHDFGLHAALDWLGKSLAKKHGLPIEVCPEEEPYTLDSDQKAICFQMVRELLINVIKHAEASHAEINTKKVNNHLVLEVKDDGRGFDTAILKGSDSEDIRFGLFNIRERLEDCGGSLHIDSSPGLGTTVKLLMLLKD